MATTEKRYEIAINDSGYDDEGNYTSKTRTFEVDEQRLQWYKDNSGKTIVDGSIFYLIDIKTL